MELNNEQYKQLAKVFDILALAALAPVLSHYTGVKEILTLSPELSLIFLGFGATLEYIAIRLLGKVK